MPSVSYGSGAYRRNNGNFPELKLVNMFVEQAKTSENQVALLSRKGLSSFASRGTGPITGIFQQAGVFSGDQFVVSGGTLYRGATSLGTIAGTGPVSFAASASELLVTAGTTLYSYNGTNLAAVAFPDSANVRSIDFHDGLFLAVRDATHKYYWSAVLNGRTWGALDFASAESKPDNLIDLKVSNDTLWLFGDETIEPWANVGDADAPYQRFEQRIFAKGIKATGCVTELDNMLWFVGSDNMVYRLADAPERISDHGIEERVAAASSVSTYAYVSEGHSFLCVRLNDATLAYDVATREWHELQSSGRANFAARCATKAGTTPYFGDDTNGTVWQLSSGYQDNAGTLERRFTAGVPLDAPLPLDNVRLWTNPGQAAGGTVDMRYSRDAGLTWSDWVSTSLGASVGDYRTLVEWRALGLFDFPGAVIEFRCQSNAPFRVSAVKVNEPGGGRSR